MRNRVAPKCGHVLDSRLNRYHCAGCIAGHRQAERGRSDICPAQRAGAACRWYEERRILRASSEHRPLANAWLYVRGRLRMCVYSHGHACGGPFEICHLKTPSYCCTAATRRHGSCPELAIQLSNDQEITALVTYRQAFRWIIRPCMRWIDLMYRCWRTERQGSPGCWPTSNRLGTEGSSEEAAIKYLAIVFRNCCQ